MKLQHRLFDSALQPGICSVHIVVSFIIALNLGPVIGLLSLAFLTLISATTRRGLFVESRTRNILLLIISVSVTNFALTVSVYLMHNLLGYGTVQSGKLSSLLIVIILLLLAQGVLAKYVGLKNVGLYMVIVGVIAAFLERVLFSNSSMPKLNMTPFALIALLVYAFLTVFCYLSTVDEYNYRLSIAKVLQVLIISISMVVLGLVASLTIVSLLLISSAYTSGIIEYLIKFGSRSTRLLPSYGITSYVYILLLATASWCATKFFSLETYLIGLSMSTTILIIITVAIHRLATLIKLGRRRT